MKSHFIILLLSFVFMLNFVNAEPPASEIINGMTGDMNGTGPFMVYISTAKSKLNADGTVPERSGCSGILIKKNIILTAAHCFLISGFDEVDVHFTLKYDPLGRYPVRHGTRIVTHPEYNKSKDIYKNDGYYENDIAIIEFAGELPKGYRPINYKISDDTVYLGGSVLVAGYGLIYDTSDPRVSVDYLNNLGRLYSTRLIFDSEFPQLNVFYTHISADQNSKTGMCRGDSGGAAVVRDANKNFLLVGINSATGNDKTCFGKAYFTRVSLFQSWIEENIK